MSLFILVVFVLLISTNYVPKRLIHSIEKKYIPIALHNLDTSKQYHILVLGAGATVDDRLPPSMDLNTGMLTRLFEGVRIFNHIDQGILVTSGSLKSETISQAQLSKEAAISVGVPEQHIKTLDNPRTTLEEAMAFKEQFGSDKKVVLVTSALHMPRAGEIFNDQGLDVIPAPSNYKYKEGGSAYNGISMPSLHSIELMNHYHITVLKQWYYRVFKK